MKNNKKMTRKTKVEKRRLAFEKRNVKKEQNLARYGAEGGSALVMAKTTEFNRRVIAAALALVFVLTTILIGLNVSVKATLANDSQIAADGTYTYTIAGNSYSTSYTYSEWSVYHYVDRTETITGTPRYKVTISVAEGKISAVNVEKNNSFVGSNGSNTQKQQWNTEINRGITNFLTGSVNARSQLIGKDATLASIKALTGADSDSSYNQFNRMKEGLIRALTAAPLAPRVPEDADDYVDPPELPDSASSYLELSKTIAPSANGNAYDLNLESYSSADTRKFEIWEKVPTDYVVVVDQSASMKTDDMATKYVSAGTVNLEDVGDETTTDDKYYYVDPNGDTYRVFAETGYLYQYFGVNQLFVGDIIPDEFFSWFTTSEVNTDMKNNYYFKTDSGYKKLNFRVVGSLLRYDVDISYKNDAGETVYFRRENQPTYKNVLNGDIYAPGSFGYGIANAAVQLLSRSDRAYTYAEVEIFGIKPRTGMYINYPMYKRSVGYTRLVYRDKNGDIIPIPSDSGVERTEYCNGSGQAVTAAGGSTRMQYTGKLLKSSQDEKRLDALKMALQVFTKTVENDVDSYGAVDNRIAFVGFSSENTDVWHYNNTEVLSGVAIDTSQKMTNGKDGRNTHNGYFPINETNFNGPQYFSGNGNYGDINAAYETALVDASTAYNAIDYFTAYGGTQPADGLDMAKEIFDARDNTTYTYRTGDKNTVDRNKVVIFFTDGQPGNYSTSNQYSEANKVVEKAYELKHDVGAKIFSIGVFGVADATPLTYQRHETTNDNHTDYEYDQGWVNTISNEKTSTTWNWLIPTTSTDTIRYYLNRYWLSSDSSKFGATPNDTIYDYMSTVSSNYPDAQKFISDAWAISGENAGDNTSEGEDPNYQSWLDMVNQLRGARIPNYGSDEGEENYYRLASNTESLIEAFKSAAEVTKVDVAQNVGEMDKDVKTIDYINDTYFDIPLVNGTLDVEVMVVPVTKAADGTITPRTPISIEEYNATHTNQLSWSPGSDNKSVIVTGFDYNDHCVTTENTNAAKLVVKIRGLTPKKGVTGQSITSNKNTSGIYSEDEMLKSFPEPAIARYKYQLNVGAADNDATFDLNYTLAANPGTTGFDNILIADESDANNIRREFYSDGNLKSINDATDGSAIYLEYITEQGENGVVDPADYSIAATIAPTSADASTYTYYLDTTNFVDLTNPDPTKVLPQPNGATISTFLTTENGAMYVNSKANNRTITIKEKVDGSFSNDTDTFTPTLYLVPPEGQTVPNDGAIYGNVTWEKDGSENRLKYTTRSIQGNDSDSVSLTVPANWKLIVEQTDSNNYLVTGKEYVLGTSDTSTDIPAGGVDITDNLTITITNTRDNIPVAGVNDSSNHNWIIYLLVGIVAVAVISGGIFLWKKKDEFVEE